MLLAAFSLSQAGGAGDGQHGFVVHSHDSCSLQLLCYVRCIQSPLNLLEEGFAGRRKICNQLLQGINEQEIIHDLVDRAVQQPEEKPSPLPPLLLTFPCQNLTAIKISFKSHELVVF